MESRLRDFVLETVLFGLVLPGLAGGWFRYTHGPIKLAEPTAQAQSVAAPPSSHPSADIEDRPDLGEYPESADEIRLARLHDATLPSAH